MMDHNYVSLELDKVLELLAEQTTCDDAAAMARELTPALYFGQV